MLAGVDRSILAGKRNAALVLLGFTTAARVSELVALDVATVKEAEHGYDVTASTPRTPCCTAATRPPAPSGPCHACLDALAAAGRTDGPLFVRVDR